MADLDEVIARRKYHEKNAAECKSMVERYDAEMKRIEDVQRMLSRQARRGQGALFRLWDAIGPETEASSAVEEERRPLREIMDVVRDLELDRDLIPAESDNPTDKRGVNIGVSSSQPSDLELKSDSAAAREELERARQRRQKPADRAPLSKAR
jgi:hypothetical protein